MSDITLQQHQGAIADAQAVYAAASDAPAIQKRINDKTNEWATRNRSAGRWIADSDVEAEHSKMAAQANAELQAAAERAQETIALGTLACERMERDAEEIVPLWQRDTTRHAGDYVKCALPAVVG
jgi:Tfp pilus assembly major pilin PilA